MIGNVLTTHFDTICLGSIGTNIAKLLEDAGYTPICPEEDQGAETPRNFDQIKNTANAKKQFIDPNKPQPCWHVVDADYPKENCEKDFAKTCNKVQPFVGVGDVSIPLAFLLQSWPIKILH